MSDTKDITENNAVNDGKDDSAVDNSSSGLVANVDDTNKAPSIAFGDGKIPTTLPALPPMAAPNSKPKLVERHIETYVYRDFANAEPTKLDTNTDDMHQGGRLPPQSLQSQKLPSKLNAMLSDPDLSSIITWMPHGRSWKILNRELFTGFALPRYFGHSNHASFVRIVNAWGFRRITKGPDRDSYYHELFLRGKPRLHERMKRLPTCHRKTPVDKLDKCPDFYELAKTSPLPELGYSLGGGVGGSVLSNASMMNMGHISGAGYSSNPMAAFGMGNHNSLLTQQSNLLGGSSSSAMDSYMSNSNKQGNDMTSLLKLLRQQGPSSLQQQQQQPQGNTDNNAMNQNLMQQLLRMQNTQSSNLTGLGSTSAAYGQPPITTSSSAPNQMLNSLTGNMNMSSNQEARRLSNDKISVNDVIQLRSIERTNELLSQKLASMQQDTQMMKQDSRTTGSSATSAIGGTMQSMSAGLVGNTASPSGNNVSREDMLMQMIRRENSKSSNQMEDNSNQMSQGLNSLLKSLTQQQQL